MNQPILSAEAKGQVPEFVEHVRKHLAESGVTLDAKVIEDALLKAQQSCGCAQCANGARW